MAETDSNPDFSDFIVLTSRNEKLIGRIKVMVEGRVEIKKQCYRTQENQFFSQPTCGPVAKWRKRMAIDLTSHW